MGNECCNEKRKDEDQKQEEVDKHIFDKIGDSFKGVRSLGFKVLEMLFIYFDLARAARNLIPEILLATDILQFCAICRASRKRRHSSTETASMIAKTRQANNFLLWTSRFVRSSTRCIARFPVRKSCSWMLL